MNILVDDDHATNRKLLHAMLEAEQHLVVEASDGVQALQVLEREPVDAIISDILMPNMDGFRLCHEVRKSEKTRDLPFIIYTSTYNSPSDQRLAQSVGADRYIMKPAPAEVILGALAEVTESSRRRGAALQLDEDEIYVLKQYSQALVSKLEEKNAELDHAIEKTQRAAELGEANEKLRKEFDAKFWRRSQLRPAESQSVQPADVRWHDPATAKP